jgi:hypothetical protein
VKPPEQLMYTSKMKYRKVKQLLLGEGKQRGEDG